MNVTTARDKLRDHLIRQGHRKDFKITPKMCSRWWSLLNWAVFNGILPHPLSFKVKDNKSQYGACHPVFDKGNVYIEISPCFHPTRADFISTLVHEMVHQWQQIYRQNVKLNDRMGHGATFFKWREPIRKSVGLELEMDDRGHVFTEEYRVKINQYREWGVF